MTNYNFSNKTKIQKYLLPYQIQSWQNNAKNEKETSDKKSNDYIDDNSEY